MGIQGKEKLFSENEPLKAPLAWHEIIRSEKQENELLSSPDVFISRFEKLGSSPVELRYLSILEEDFAEISPGLYIETNILPEMLDNLNLTNYIGVEVAALLAKKRKFRVTAELPPDLANLLPKLSGEQIDIDFGNAFFLNAVFCVEHGGTVFEIVPPFHTQAVDKITEVIEGKTDGFIVLKP